MIDTERLTKAYQGVTVVDALTLRIEAGEIFGFLGPNGAGKTTTIRMLTTLTRPTSGRASVCGHDVVTSPMAVRQRIGYVMQEITVDTMLTARENLVLQGHLYHLSKGTLDQRVAELLELVELADRADQRMKTFSGGMKKRLDLACGLIHQPEVLFLDEPTLGLDVQTRHRIWDHVRDLRARGVTIFLATNYLDEADRLCDRVAIIDHGRIVALDTPVRLKQEIGGDVVMIRFPDGASCDGLSAKLLSLPTVTQVVETTVGFHLSVRAAEEAIPQIIRLMGENGTEVQSLTYAHPTLDDVFLRHTGRQLRE